MSNPNDFIPGSDPGADEQLAETIAPPDIPGGATVSGAPPEADMAGGDVSADAPAADDPTIPTGADTGDDARQAILDQIERAEVARRARELFAPDMSSPVPSAAPPSHARIEHSRLQGLRQLNQREDEQQSQRQAAAQAQDRRAEIEARLQDVEQRQRAMRSDRPDDNDPALDQWFDQMAALAKEHHGIEREKLAASDRRVFLNRWYGLGAIEDRSGEQKAEIKAYQKSANDKLSDLVAERERGLAELERLEAIAEEKRTARDNSQIRFWKRQLRDRDGYDEQIKEAKEKLAIADAMASGKLPAPVNTAFVTGVDNIVSSAVNMALVGLVKSTAIAYGYGREARTANAKSELARLESMSEDEIAAYNGDPAFGPALRPVSSSTTRWQTDMERLRKTLQEDQGFEIESTSVYKFAETVDGWVKQTFPGDVARQQDFAQKLANGIGSAAGFMGTGMVGALLKAPKAVQLGIIATAGSAQQASQTFDEASEAMRTVKTVKGPDGKETRYVATAEDRAKATFFGAMIGMSEAAPFSRLLGESAGDAVRGVFWSRVRRRMGNAWTEGFPEALEEAAQETFQGVTGNLNAAAFYDPERKWDKDVAENALIGFIIGGGMGGAKGAMSNPAWTREDHLADIKENVAAAVARGPLEPEIEAGLRAMVAAQAPEIAGEIDGILEAARETKPAPKVSDREATADASAVAQNIVKVAKAGSRSGQRTMTDVEPAPAADEAAIDMRAVEKWARETYGADTKVNPAADGKVVIIRRGPVGERIRVTPEQGGALADLEALGFGKSTKESADGGRELSDSEPKAPGAEIIEQFAAAMRKRGDKGTKLGAARTEKPQAEEPKQSRAAGTPTFEQIKARLPRDENNYPDLVALGAIMQRETGKSLYRDLTDEEVKKVFDALAPEGEKESKSAEPAQEQPAPKAPEGFEVKQAGQEQPAPPPQPAPAPAEQTDWPILRENRKLEDRSWAPDPLTPDRVERIGRYLGAVEANDVALAAQIERELAADQLYLVPGGLTDGSGNTALFRKAGQWYATDGEDANGDLAARLLDLTPISPLDANAAAKADAVREAESQVERRVEPVEAPPVEAEEPLVLYRGEGPDDPWRRQNRGGEWYTTDLERALSYAGDRPDRRGVFRIEVPKDRVGELKRGLHDDEYMVPADLDRARSAVEPQTVAETGPTLAEKLDAGRERARNYVLLHGRKSGREYGVMVLANGAAKPVVPTDRNGTAYLEVSPETAPELWTGKPRSADLHHNHPRSTSFSRGDFAGSANEPRDWAAGNRPGLRRSWVHGHDGSEYWVEMLADAETLGAAYDIARAATEKIDAPDLPRYRAHVVVSMMADAGIVRYGATLAPADAQSKVEAITAALGEAWPQSVSAIQQLMGGSSVSDRRAGPTGRSAGVDGVPEGDADARSEPGGSAGGDQSGAATVDSADTDGNGIISLHDARARAQFFLSESINAFGVIDERVAELTKEAAASGDQGKIDTVAAFKDEIDKVREEIYARLVQQISSTSAPKTWAAAIGFKGKVDGIDHVNETDYGAFLDRAERDGLIRRSKNGAVRRTGRKPQKAETVSEVSTVSSPETVLAPGEEVARQHRIDTLKNAKARQWAEALVANERDPAAFARVISSLRSRDVSLAVIRDVFRGYVGGDTLPKTKNIAISAIKQLRDERMRHTSIQPTTEVSNGQSQGLGEQPKGVPEGSVSEEVPADGEGRDAGTASDVDRGIGGGDVRVGFGAGNEPQGAGRDVQPAVGEAGAGAEAGGRPDQRGSAARSAVDQAERQRVAEAVEAARKQAELEREQRIASNYRITDEDEIGQGGPKAKVRANLAAIKLAKAIEAEERQATQEEKRILVKYVGWGAFAQQLFDEISDTHKESWKAERDELKSLLSLEEYEAARKSTLNAHYTSPEVIRGMWAAMEHLGVTPQLRGAIRALEPSAGVGHFIGMMPQTLAPKVDWTGVELDRVTGLIGKLLYGGSDMRIGGFEQQRWPDGFFDVAISNVPFGAYNITDPAYKRPYRIHDYFFVKALDKVRPGGIVAFITSHYTLDKLDDSARSEIARRSTFLGAIRLPGGKKGAFAGNAGTDVTTDIIFLRRRMDGEPIGDQSWTELADIRTKDGPHKINRYFAENPQMMLGEMRLTGTMRGGDKEPMLVGTAENIDVRIAEVARNMMADAFVQRGHGSKAFEETPVDTATDGIKEGSFYEKGGKLFHKVAGVGEPLKLSKVEEAKVRGLMEIRDIVSEILAKQGRGDKRGMDDLRAALNSAYDKFVKKYGPINKTTVNVTSRLTKSGDPVVIRKMPNLASFLDDVDAYKVAAVENYDEGKDTATKAAIFTTDILGSYERPNVASPADVLSVSLNESGKVDMPLIAKLLKVSEEEAATLLGDKVFMDPNGDVWRMADEYLAGDVVTKLQQARDAAAIDPKYARNVAALESVQPETRTRLDIDLSLGAPWIPMEVIAEFVRERMGAPRYGELEIYYNVPKAEWSVARRAWASTSAQNEFGTGRKLFTELLEAALNQKTVKVWDEVDGKKYVNLKASEEANAKVKAIRDAFAGSPEAGVAAWVWENEERAQQVEAIYNATMNRVVQQTYDGSHLTFPGLATSISLGDGRTVPFALRKHQRDAVWRQIVSGNTLLAHTVGAGKTLEMIVGGMEQKRLGLIQRPMYVVPNHMLEQFSREFLQAYPNAKLLVADKESMSKAKRKSFAARVAADRWDGIIITHDAYGRLPMSPKAYEAFFREQITELRESIADDVADGKRKKNPTVKQIEKMISSLEEKIKKLLAESRKDDGVTFEELGVDYLYVDELHLFKNLQFASKHSQVKGIGNSASQRATDMFVKVQYLEQMRPGRAITGATGTPISNSMAELYTMMRYLQLPTLKQIKADRFDAWAATYGEMVSDIEVTTTGKMKEVVSFSRFKNMQELARIFGLKADVKTAADLNLPRPNLKGGKPIVVEAEPSEQEESYQLSLVARAEKLSTTRVDPKEDNHLKIVSEGRKVGTDMRLIDPDAPFNPTGKVAMAIDNIYRIYQEGNDARKAGNDAKLAQMVFLDMGVPGTRRKPKAAAPDDEPDNLADIARRTKKLEDATGADEAPEVVSEDEAEHEIDKESLELFTGSFDLYNDIRDRLVERGMKREEIAFIHDAKTDAQKAIMFAKVRKGEIRLLIGSTGKMGVGTNVQQRLIAMHHIDVPWKPAEVEQRDGRILRQGNMNPEIEIYRYVTKRSTDAFMWQTVERKLKWITQFLAGARGIKGGEDIGDTTIDAATMKALATGNPLLIEEAQLKKTVKELEIAQRSFLGIAAGARRQLEAVRKRAEQDAKAVERFRADAAKVLDLRGDKFKVTLEVGSAPMAVSERKKAGEALRAYMLRLGEGMWNGREIEEVVGELSGLTMKVLLKRTDAGIYARYMLEGQVEYGTSNEFAIVTKETDPVSIMRRFEGLLSSVPAILKRAEDQARANLANIPTLEKQAAGSGEFPRQAELAAAQKRLGEVMAGLKAQSEKKDGKANDGAPDVSDVLRAIGGFSGKRETAREASRRFETELLAGRAVTISDPRLADGILSVAKSMAHIVPVGTRVGTIVGARPLSGPPLLDSENDIIVSCVDIHGVTFDREMRADVFLGSRAVVGLDDKVLLFAHLGRFARGSSPLVETGNPDAAPSRDVGADEHGIVGVDSNEISVLRAELVHEAIHALRLAGLLDGEQWALLVAHAKSLGVLDGLTVAEYETELGLEAGSDHRTLIEAYSNAYSSFRPRTREEYLDQEHVCHMAELFVLGKIPPEWMPEDVRLILSRIISGEVAERSAGKPSAEAAGLAAELSPETAADPAAGGESDGGSLSALADYVMRTSIDDLAARNGAISIAKIRPWQPHPGRVLAFHGTTADFERFDADQAIDVGQHFGTPAIAGKFAGGQTFRGDASELPGRVFPAVLQLERPVTLPDLGDWSPKKVVAALRERGIAVSAELDKLASIAARSINRRGFNRKLREHLVAAGYDGIRYLNAVEGMGLTWSYIAIKEGTVESATAGNRLLFALGSKPDGIATGVETREPDESEAPRLFARGPFVMSRKTSTGSTRSSSILAFAKPRGPDTGNWNPAELGSPIGGIVLDEGAGGALFVGYFDVKSAYRNTSAARHLIEAAEQELGLGMGPADVMSEATYRAWKDTSPLVAKLWRKDPLLDGVWLSPLAMVRARDARTELGLDADAAVYATAANALPKQTFGSETLKVMTAISHPVDIRLRKVEPKLRSQLYVTAKPVHDDARGEYTDGVSVVFIDAAGAGHVITHGHATEAAARAETERIFRERGVDGLRRYSYIDGVQRRGADWRAGRNMSLMGLESTFGLRTVVPPATMTDTEAQRWMNALSDALMDMAFAIGIPPQTVGLGGWLSIKFHTDLPSGALAQFVVQGEAIELGRTTGPGSIAHEWFHALDYHFAKLAGGPDMVTQAVAKSRTYYVSVNALLRPEMATAWDRVMVAVLGGDPADLEALRRIQRKDLLTQSDLDRINVLAKRLLGERSQFSITAQNLDAAYRDSKPYYNTPVELAARAFEAYVRDKLDMADAFNRFLVRKGEGATFPAGADRGRVIAAFDGFFDAIEAVETERGVMLRAIGSAPAEEQPLTNKDGFVLLLPFKDRWGNARQNEDDFERSYRRLNEISDMKIPKVEWSEIERAYQDLVEISANVLFYDPGIPLSEFKAYFDSEVWIFASAWHNPGFRNATRRSFFDNADQIPDPRMKELSIAGRRAMVHLLTSSRSGIKTLLKFGPKAVKFRSRKAVNPAATMASGFYFNIARKLEDAPERQFQMGGQHVINWLRKQGVTAAEMDHFQLQEKFGDNNREFNRPVTRQIMLDAIKERMFDFKRKVSWLNPERSPGDYELKGTRAFTGPRVPGRGVYFERLMAFPKRLKGGATFYPGGFVSPHWSSELENAWGSWRGSLREVEGWGAMLLGEEGQSDYMQGATSGRRPRKTEAEVKQILADQKQYAAVISDAQRALYTALHAAGIDPHSYSNDSVFIKRDLLPSLAGVEYPADVWEQGVESLRQKVLARRRETGNDADASHGTGAIAELLALRRNNERFFAPGAKEAFGGGKQVTPVTPIDETWVRVMVRDLLLAAVGKDADSVAISTTETSDRIQANTYTSAGFFYDSQLLPTLQKELRRLTGDGNLELQKVALPKAMGAPKREKPYTVWAAKLSEEVKSRIEREGLALMAMGSAPEPEPGPARAVAIGDIGRLDAHPEGPVLAFHATDAAFDRFDVDQSGSFGMHFGTREAANAIDEVADERSDARRVIPVVLNLGRVLTVSDRWSWQALDLAQVIEGEAPELAGLAAEIGRQETPEGADEALRERLTSAGIDGIRYWNEIEGQGGWSYMVWEPGRGLVTSALTDDDMFALDSDAADRQALIDRLTAGEGFDHGEEFVDRALQAVEPHLGDVPKGVAFGVLRSVVPDASRPGIANFSFVRADGIGRFRLSRLIDDLHNAAITLANGKALVLQPFPVSGAKGGARLGVQDGADNRGRGGIVLDQFPKVFVRYQRGLLAHEIVHAIINRDLLAPADRAALLDHANFLSVMQISVARLERARGIEDGGDTRTLEWAYKDLYSARPDRRTAIENEAITHLAELSYHNFFTADKIAPVREILARLLPSYFGPAAVAAPTPIVEPLQPEEDDGGGLLFALGSRPQSGAEDSETGRAMRRDLDALGYYSQAFEAARGLKQAKGTPEQMLAQLRNAGVKQAEIEATGLLKFLGLEPGSADAARRQEGSGGPNQPQSLRSAGDQQGQMPASFQGPQGLESHSSIANALSSGAWREASDAEAAKYLLNVLAATDLDQHVGVRVTQEPLAIGDRAPDSRVWDDGEPTDETLNGASAIQIKDSTNVDSIENALREASSYDGNYISVITSRYGGHGQDRGEIILPNNRVVAAIGRTDRDIHPKLPSWEWPLVIPAEQNKAPKPPSVTRDEIVSYLESNRVRLKEARYGDTHLPPNIDEAMRERDELVQWLTDNDTPAMRTTPEFMARGDRVNRLHDTIDEWDRSGAGSTKWSSYSLDPSNPSYRETVLHLPGRGGPELIPNTAGDWGNTGGAGGMMRNSEFDRQNVVTGHFPEPNIVGHMMTSMVKHEEKPTYLIDQIQSDWGQTLRDNGIKTPEALQELRQRRDDLEAQLNAIPEVRRAAELRTSEAMDARDALPEVQRIRAELRQAQDAYAAMGDDGAEAGHPLVNTTDQWVNTTLRRAIRQAAEADADYIAIPHGDTVLSYNPGDPEGMRGFYGSRDREGIVPKNLRKLLEKIDKENSRPVRVEVLETPTAGFMSRADRNMGQFGEDPDQAGFTLFPLTDKVKDAVINEGQMLFALGSRGGDPGMPPSFMSRASGRPGSTDMSPDARKHRAELLGFDTSTVYYHGTVSSFDGFGPLSFFTPYAEDADDFATKKGRAYGENGELTTPEKARIIPVYIRGDLMVMKEPGIPGTVEGAMKYGFDPAKHTGWRSRNGREIVVVDPSNVRSVNATFDPDEARSSNLLAAIGSAPSTSTLSEFMADRVTVSSAETVAATEFYDAYRDYLSARGETDAMPFAGFIGAMARQNVTVNDEGDFVGITLTVAPIAGNGVVGAQTSVPPAGTRPGGGQATAPPPAGPPPGSAPAPQSPAQGPIRGLSDLVGELVDALGLPRESAGGPRVGRLNPGLKAQARAAGLDLAGQFDRVTGVVRIAVPNDLETLAHEGGHALEVSPRLRSPINQFKANFSAPLVGMASPGPDALSEGFAEFFRQFVLDPVNLELAEPTMFEEFQDLLDAHAPQMLTALEDIQSGWAALQAASPTELVKSRSKSTQEPGTWWGKLRQELADKGWRESIADRWYSFQLGYMDKAHPLQKAVSKLLEIAEENIAPTLGDRERITLKAANDPYKLMRLHEHTRVWATSALMYGIKQAGDIDPSGPSMHDVLRTAIGSTDKAQWTDERLGDFNDYLIARRMVAEFERFNAGQRPEAPDLVMNEQTWISAVGKSEADNPTFDAAAALFYEFGRNLLRLKWEAGFLTDDLYNELISRSDYAPLQRILDDGARFAGGKGNRNKSEMIRRQRNSSRDFIWPVESVIQDVYATMSRVSINNIVRTLDSVARAAGPNGGAIAERIPAKDMKATRIDVRDAAEAAAKQAGLDPADAAMLLDTIDHLFDQDAMAVLFRAVDTNEKGEPIVYLWENGKRIPIRLGDDELGRDIFDMFAALGQHNWDMVHGLLARSADALRWGVTKSPAYIAANFIRDQVATWVLSENFTPLVTGVSGLRSIVANDEWVWRYGAVAGHMGGIDTATEDALGLQHDIRTLRKTGILSTSSKIAMVARGTEISEFASRLGHFKAAYERAIRDGLTPQEAMIEAAYSAHDAMDFSRKGASSGYRGLARFVPFLNAKFQGLSAAFRTVGGSRDRGVAVRTLVSPYVKAMANQPLTIEERRRLPQSAKALIKMLTIGAIGLIIYANYDDDEESEEFNDQMRATHWFINVGFRWVRIPKPFELAIVSNIFEASYDYFWKGDPRAGEKLQNSLKHTIGFPFTNVMEVMRAAFYGVQGNTEEMNKSLKRAADPDIDVPLISLFYEWKSGHDMFRDKAIISQTSRGLSPEQQFSAYTSELAKVVGQTMKWSPEMVDHFVNGVWGSLGRDFMAWSNWYLPAMKRTLGEDTPGLGNVNANRPPTSLEDWALVSRFMRRAARGSLSVEEFWKQMSQEGGKHRQAAATYKDILRSGRPIQAAEYLAALDPSRRAYTVLEAHFKEQDQQLNPLNRAETVLKTISGMRKEMNLDRLIRQDSQPSTTKPWREQERIDIPNEKLKGVNEILEDIAMREARNALIASGHPGWAQKKISDTNALLAELRAHVPDVADELADRLSKQKGGEKVYSFDAVRQVWPKVKDRLLAQGRAASLADLRAEALGESDYRALRR